MSKEDRDRSEEIVRAFSGVETLEEKYKLLRGQVVWAVTHWGLIPIEGIMEVLRNTVIGLDSNKDKNIVES